MLSPFGKLFFFTILLHILTSIFRLKNFVLITYFGMDVALLGSIGIYAWESMIPLGFLAATGYVTVVNIFPFLFYLKGKTLYGQ